MTKFTLLSISINLIGKFQNNNNDDDENEIGEFGDTVPSRASSTRSQRLSMNSVAIVDDNPLALALMRKTLERAGFSDIRAYSSPTLALDAIRADLPSVLLLDYVMPQMDGLDFLRRLTEEGLNTRLPVALVSNSSELDMVRIEALRAGAVEVLRKPMNDQELGLKVRNLSRLSPAVLGQVPMAHGSFEPLKVPRSHVSEPLGMRAQSVLARVLARVSSVRDEQTGRHTQRMAHYAVAIAASYGFTLEQQEQLLAAAPLHDLGKVAVHDDVLSKSGSFTGDERRLMRRHTTVGYELLRHEPSPTLQLAAEIALAHHEHWDGSGYPLGLAREHIPISARIVAVADVFDALTTIRPFRQDWLMQRARDVIVSDAGGQFDPAVIDAFERAFPELIRIKQHFDGGEVCISDDDPLSKLMF